MEKIFVLCVIDKAVKRFFRNVTKTDDCWHWSGSSDKDGYGVISMFGSQQRAHRVSLVIAGTDVSNGLACHTCDNPSCVNPNHLYVGDQKQNVRDAMLKGRRNTGWSERKHCIHGHPLSGKNLYIYKNTGQRMCRKCRSVRSLEKYHREKKEKYL